MAEGKGNGNYISQLTQSEDWGNYIVNLNHDLDEL
jgi:hypothetical protein